ncbi:MAG TPA: hypothetical protein VE890_06545 [Thermoguttaceae bacterium]|nr:hypothetical protein [Thermoguttaceae bacterium]
MQSFSGTVKKVASRSLSGSKPTGNVNLKIATGRRELSEAFRLVYQCYRERGYATRHPSKMLYHASFGLPSSRTIVATAANNEVIGTVTVVGDNRFGFQLDPVYRTEITRLRKSGRRLGEVTCLAIKPTNRFGPREVFFGLTQYMIHYAYWQKFDDLLLSVHPRHHRFYWRHFRVFPLGACHAHAAACDNPAVGCRMDLAYLGRNMDADLWERYFGEIQPEDHYKGPPVSADDHHYFCEQRSIAPNTDGCRESDKERNGRHREAA